MEFYIHLFRSACMITFYAFHYVLFDHFKNTWWPVARSIANCQIGEHTPIKPTQNTIIPRQDIYIGISKYIIYLMPNKFSYQPINPTYQYTTRSKHTAFYDENKQQVQLRSCQNGFTRPYPLTGWQYLELNSIYFIFDLKQFLLTCILGHPRLRSKSEPP